MEFCRTLSEGNKGLNGSKEFVYIHKIKSFFDMTKLAWNRSIIVDFY